MRPVKHYLLLLLSLALAMMMLSACGQGGSSIRSGSTPSSTTPSSLTPLEVIQKSADAMKNLKTLHIELDETSQVTGANVTGLQTLPNMTVTLKGSGDQSVPDKQQKMDLAVTTPNLSTQVSDIVTSDKAYIKIGQGQWYVVDKSNSDYTGGSHINIVFSSPTIDQSGLLGLIGHADITDHGTENLNGQSLRHITAKLDKAAFQQLVSDNPNLKGNFRVQNLNSVQNFSASVDVYIDEKQFYVHRTMLKANMGLNDNNITAGTTIDLTLDLSKFNQPVTITAPANAASLTDPKQLLDGMPGLYQHQYQYQYQYQ